MSLYTTPLQLGYFFSLLLWLIFLIRGYRQQRLSDKLLGWIMFILAMELQDYTFGFAGINVLWNELNGFPRGVSFLFGPAIYFYFLAQTNRSFHFKTKHLWHLIPYTLYFIYHIFFFVQGPEVVTRIQESTMNNLLTYLVRISLILLFTYYLRRCLQIYKAYREWSLEQFSNLDLIDFKWFRNFIYAMIFWLICRELMNALDAIFDLDFYQDWWWNLALVAVAMYIGLAGISQKQPAQIAFDESSSHTLSDRSPDAPSVSLEIEKKQLAHLLVESMTDKRLFLQANLTLHELAQHLQTTPTLLSATINQVFKMNFNDYINTLRIDEFISRYERDTQRKYTLLALAFEAGFNSKATFNRAFKKIKGSSPVEFLK